MSSQYEDHTDDETVLENSHRIWEDVERLAEQNPDYLPSPLKRSLLAIAAFAILGVGLVFTPFWAAGVVLEDATNGQHGKMLKAPTQLGLIMFFVAGLLALMGERNAMRHQTDHYGGEE